MSGGGLVSWLVSCCGDADDVEQERGVRGQG